MVLILDLDGVLITTPPWRVCPVEDDGFSRFNMTAVANLNTLLIERPMVIWVSSARRLNYTLEDFNRFFKNRGIQQEIKGFLPESQGNRCNQFENFVEANNIVEFIAIDDDKSLNASKYKSNIVVTRLRYGFDNEKLEEALKIIRK